MAKRHEKHPFDDSAEGLLDWMGSPQGQLSIEASDTLWGRMENVQVDPRQRELIWPRAQRLSLEQSVARLHQEYPRFPRERIESFLISWLEHYAPDSYSQEQLEELDRLIDPWVDGYEPHPKPEK